MLKLKDTFDKINWKELTNDSPRSVAALAKKLDIDTPISLREVMSAAWEEVTFQSLDPPPNTLTLVGYLFKPLGPGPFPAIIWNHGSEHDERLTGGTKDKSPTGSSFHDQAKLFVSEGYVFFAPLRRGHGKSGGTFIGGGCNGGDLELLFVQKMEGEQLDDQLAGLKYLKNQHFEGQSLVDVDRLAVMGGSYGGTQSLLAAEKGAGYKACIVISPAAETWDCNESLQVRLLKAVQGTDIPVLLIHPNQDKSLKPGRKLSREFARLNKSYGLLIYPPLGHDGHSFDGHGTSIWGPDVLKFLAYNKIWSEYNQYLQ